jgi:hypothetical protein
MSSRLPDNSPKALVAVFENQKMAAAVVDHLNQAGFDQNKIGLITHDVKAEYPNLETPKVHETTNSKLESGALKGAGIGVGVAAGFGAAVGVLAASPAIAIGAMIYAGFAGALIGGMGGVDNADLDDSVNLPTPEEYQSLLDEGKSLLVIGGTHDELMKAETIVKNLPHASANLHRLHGHLFHEHPVAVRK